jgi:hypothetical protein
MHRAVPAHAFVGGYDPLPQLTEFAEPLLHRIGSADRPTTED